MSEYEEKTPEEVEELLLLLADFSSEGKRSKKALWLASEWNCASFLSLPCRSLFPHTFCSNS
jgi:hypothetical protein